MEVIAKTKEELDDAKKMAMQHLDHYMNNCFLGLPPEQIGGAWAAIEGLAAKRKAQAMEIGTLP